MISTLVLEDDPYISEDLCVRLNAHGKFQPHPALDLATAQKVIREKSIDLAILDIELPGNRTAGLELAQTLSRKTDIPFVFLTSYAHFKKAAWTLKPAGFLPKPFHDNMLTTLELAYLNHIWRPSVPKHYSILEGSSYVRLDLETLHWMRAQNNGTFLKYADGKQEVNHRLKTILAQLPDPRLVQISRDCVVNVNYVTAYNPEEVVVNFDKKFAPSTSGYKELQRRFTMIKTRIDKFG